eukprot:15609643-Heterocapsa_arctica.AAC.1
MGGYSQKGKGKQKKGDYPPYQGRWDYSLPSVQKGNKGQTEQNGKASMGESIERKKLGQMRT